MKRIVFLSLTLLTLFSGCQKDDTDMGPEDRPDARINKALADYKAQLVGAPNGWKAVLYPDGGAAYSFHLKFTESGRVIMAGDIDATTTTPLESSYRLKALQKPALLFDTYNYLHILADPDPTKSRGEQGWGKYSDFEFSFEAATPETITLKGNLLGSKLVLVKATADDALNFVKRVSASAQAFEKINTFTTYFKRLTLGSSVFDITVNAEVRVITFTYYVGNTLRSFTTTYFFTEDGLKLLEPFTVGTTTITDLKSIQFDNAAKRLSFTINNANASIQEATRPIVVDTQAPGRFFNAPPNGSYWATGAGFTINGVPDALKVSSIPGFQFLVYWPKFNAQNNKEYDLLGFVLNNAISFGPAALPTLTTDGRIIYTYLGMLGAANLSTQAAPIVNATQQVWTEPQGFYVIETQNGVDLVSAKDARAWISFE